MNQRQLILASSSIPRQNLLQRLALPFEIAVPNVDETPHPNEVASDLVVRLAEKKARAVAKQYPNALIIGADQVGVLGKEIQGKPHTYDNAVKQLQKASGQVLHFFIGLCLLDTHNDQMQCALETYDVLYRPLSLPMIESYLRKEQPFECAGSCKAEGLGITLIEKFSGNDFTALIGLPLIRLISFLEKVGVSPLH